ncbi:MAG: cyclic nucleotide-binding domain-containing protein [Planctomycetota bacterium]|nr:cyclic nucleotide-binding domain-containing protein [Planctomycetota bacterium]
MTDPDHIAALEQEIADLGKEKATIERTVVKAVEGGAEAEADAAEEEQRRVERKIEGQLEELVPLLEVGLEAVDEDGRAELQKKLAKAGDQLEILRLKKRYEPVRLFRAMKDAAWKALGKFRRVDVCQTNTVFVNQGEYTGEFHVIIEGLVSAYRAEPGGETVKLGTLGAGDWFGEMSALSNQPAMATIKSEQRCIVIAIDQPLFKILYSQNAFKHKIDARYRDRALAAHLRAAPVLKGIAEEKVLRLQEEARLVVFEEGDVICRSGEEGDAMYLVRTGSVKCTRVDPATGGEQIVAYLKDNSSFGERALSSSDRTRRLTVTALERTDVVELSREVIERVYADDPETLDTIVATADAILSAEEGGHNAIFDILSDSGTQGRLTRDQLEIMVARQSVKGGEALVIDLTRCTRCNACVEACVAVHDDRVSRLSKTGNRISTGYVLTTACYHCDTPDCMSKCNDGAIRRDIKGSIHFIWDNCTGCTACITGCPYGVIRMADLTPAKRTTSPYGGPRLLEGIPLLGRLFAGVGKAAAKAEAKAEDGLERVSKRTGRKVKDKKAIKCDLCAGLPFEACVYNCPCHAIERRDPESLFEHGRA